MVFGVPSQKDLDELFNFVTDEDRKRWNAESQANNQGQKKNFSNGMFSKGGDMGEKISQERRQAAEFGNVRRAPIKRTIQTTVTERIREEEDLDY